MNINLPDQLIIGLTGSFGSGTSYIRRLLVEKFNFVGFSLSAEIFSHAEKHGIDRNNRSELQEIGNKLREGHGKEYLAIKALERASVKLEEGGSDLEGKPLVFDSFRNPSELSVFRDYKNFFLIAVDCTQKERWERIKDKYLEEYGDNDKALEAFLEQDERDKDEHIGHGQKVQDCVDEADIVISNEKFIRNIHERDEYFSAKLKRYVDLLTGISLRRPYQDEAYMAVASTLAKRSSCLKRKVGAVVVDNMTGDVISMGFNEVPLGKLPCIELHGGCYRDKAKEKHLNEIDYCPKCAAKLEKPLSASDECPGCGRELAKIMFGSKILDLCQSLHAEEHAIIRMGSRYIPEDLTIYTTTFPCLLCANKIVQTRIKHVVYIEPYPVKEAAETLVKGGIEIRPFEGVKAQAYIKLFEEKH